MKKRNLILVLLVAIGVITFLDRIAVSVAGASIMDDLNLSESQWGWILSSFILTYGLSQIPLGVLGDIKGQRKILAGSILWWSLFTLSTGLAGGFGILLVARLLLGIGEGGAYPCMTGTIGHWFPKTEIAKAQGYIWAASRLGGALTPFLVVPILLSLGWRISFYSLGAIGLVWVLFWFMIYKDKPEEMKGISQKELDEINRDKKVGVRIAIPWKVILSKRQFWLLLAMYWSYAWGSWFFFSWFPTFLEKGREFGKDELSYVVAVPFFMGVLGNITGGYLSDYFSKRYGLKVGRRVLGISGLVASSVLMLLAGAVSVKMVVAVLLSFSFGFMDLMVPGAWALCLDIGEKYGGAISGAMNTAGNIGGFTCALVFGYVVQSTQNYNIPLFIISGMLLVSAFLFFKINPEKSLI